jgi:hypothetical protein
MQEANFVADSLLEGDGFEPSVPIRRTTLFEGPPANLDPSRAACLGMLSAAHKMLIQGMFSNSRAQSPHASPGSTLI